MGDHNPLYTLGDEPAPIPTRDLQPLLEKAKLYATMKEQAEVINGVVSNLAKEIGAWFPEEPGDHTQVLVDGTVVEVKRSETWNWDSGALEAMFATTPLPDHVKRKFSVTKKDYLRLSEEDQKELRPALTRGLGAPRVTVTLGSATATAAVPTSTGAGT